MKEEKAIKPVVSSTFTNFTFRYFLQKAVPFVVDNEGMHQLLLTWVFLLCTAVLSAQVTFKQHDESITVLMDGEEFTTFYFGSETTKPYLHPLRTPEGTIVTRSYPMEEIPGEQHDHPHHRGVWFSHGEVNEFDFWANEKTQNPQEKKGLINLIGIDAVEAPVKYSSSENAGRIRARFSWDTPNGDSLLNEQRTMVFLRSDSDNMVDFDIILTATTDHVHFGDTKEGTFAVRLATELEEQHFRAKGIPRTGVITNANGATTEANTWGKRSPWVDYAGSIQGNPIGVSIFDHPKNTNHPGFWHVRAYGLFAANIFGEHHFYADDSRDGSITLNKGESLRFRYRILIHPGSTSDANVADKYKMWLASQ